MSFKVQVGPPQIAIHQGHSVLVSDEDGQIKWPTDRGLYFFDTRLISAWAMYANGEPWDLLNGGAITYDSARDVPDQSQFPDRGWRGSAADARLRPRAVPSVAACMRIWTFRTTGANRCASTWRSHSAPILPTFLR